MEHQQNGHEQKKSPLPWILGCGCLGILAIIACIVALSIAGIGLGITGIGAVLKNNEPYKDSITAVQTNPAAIEALGEPIEPGLIPSGNINVNNGVGEVDFNIGVSGPKGAGTIKIIGKKTDGIWTYQTWHLKVDGQEKVIPLGK